MRKTWLLLVNVLLVFMTSTAFSALSTSLSITSEVKFRPLADIRVNSIAIDSANGGIIAYESDYSKNTSSSGFTLPTQGSDISYRVHIDNSGDVDYSIYNIVNTKSDNNVNVSISGYNVRDVIPARSSVDLIITYTTPTPSENVINVVNSFEFKKVYYITYETGTNQIIPAQVKYEGVDTNITSTQPTKNGYTFSKWNTISDGTGINYNSGAQYTLDADLTLYARYNLDTYNINYIMNHGQNDIGNPSTYTFESNNITLLNASKELVFKGNYNSTAGTNAGSSSGVSIGSDTTQVQTFAGWTGNGTTTATTSLVLPTGSYGDKEYTAHWTAVAGTVPTISRTGYTCGWSTSSSGTTIEIPSGGTYATSRITEDMDTEINLYGVCEINAYTVTYNTTENGGSGSIPNASVAYGNTIDLTPTATKTGWTFVGWNTDKNETVALSSLNMGLDNVTLYAIYRKEAINLVANWNANGATLSSTSQSSCTLAAVYNNAVQDTSCEVTAPTITRSGYDIIGFNTTSTATINNSSYNKTTGKLTLTSSNTGNTWYAITKSQTAHTATFLDNNGATVSTSTKTCYLYNNSNTCVVAGPIVTAQQGFSHIGFNTTSSATTNNSSYTLSTNMLVLSGDGTWYPITRSNTQYTGTFTIQDTNAATKSGGVLSCYRYNGATDCQITAPTLTAQAGYTVVGWDKTQMSPTAAYTSGANILINQDTNFYSVTYYNTVLVINFNKNASNSRVVSQTPSGGVASTDTNVPVSCTKMNGATTCTITSPTMDVSVGYHAVGYNTAANAAISTWNENTDKSMEFDATYYAITAPNTYTIHYNANCPSGIIPTGSMSDQSMTYGVAANLTANGYDCPGRVFKGWTTNAEGTGTLYQDEESVANLSPTHEATVNMYGVWRYQEPSPTISGGTTKTFGTTATTLTCNENTTYPSGTDKYYAFGYTTASGGTPDNWTTASTTNTLSIAANAYVGTRYYSCRVYATNGVEESDTIVSSNSTTMAINNAMITYNAGNCGTISGTNPSYVNNSMTGVYTEINNTTVGSIPTANKSGYTFTGWYSPPSKNMLDMNDWMNKSDFTITRGTAVKGNNSITITATDHDCYTSPYYGDTAYKIAVKPSTTYTLSWDVDDPSVVLRMFIFHFSGNSNTIVDMTEVSQSNLNHITFTTISDAEFITFRLGVPNTNDTVTFSNLQLEEGSSRTTYEQFRGDNIGLPSGYTQLEYIESTGLQYIDTGFKHTQDTRMIADIDLQPNGAWKSPFGSWGAPSSGTKKMFGAEYNGTTTLSMIYGNFQSYNITDQTVYFGRHIWDFNKNTFTIGTTSKTYTAETFTSDFNDIIFGNSGYNGIPYGYTTMKLYSFKIYDNNTLVRNYIPCLNNSTGIAGLYETVNSTFYTNGGTGQFVVGSKQKVIESDGTIDTSVSDWTDSNGKWLFTDNRTLVANCTLDKYSISYNFNSGVQGSQCASENGTCTFVGTKQVCYGANSSYICKTATNSVACTNAEFGSDPINGVAKACYISSNPVSYTYEDYPITLGNPTRTGYTFAGWSGTGLTGTTNTSVTIPSHSVGNRTYTANWTANGYTVTFNYQNNIYDQNPRNWTMHGATVVDSAYQYDSNSLGMAIYSNTSQYTGLNIPLNADKKTNTNYRLSVFAKRPVSITGNLRVYSETRNSSNAVISYNHNINANNSTTNGSSFTELATTFNSGAYSTWPILRLDYDTASQGPIYVGNIRLDEYTTQTKTYGSTYGSLPTPTRTGYTFAGWYTAATGGTQITSSTQVTTAGNHTLYAHWTVNNYNLTVQPNGGSFNGTTSNVTYTQNYDTPRVLPVPTRTGYTFAGWNKTAGNGTVEKFGTPKYNEPYSSVGVYNNSNNGTVTHTSVSRTSDSPIAMSSNMLQIKTAGTASPGLGGFYQSTQSRANATFYHVIVAKIPVGYTIQHAQNLTGDNRVITWLTPQAGTGKFETYIYKHVCGSSGTFSTFGHVYLSGAAATSSNPVTWYVAYANVFDATAGVPENSGQVFRYNTTASTLQAKWTAHTYTVAYNGNGNTGGSTASSSHTYGVAKNLTANGFTRTNCSFNGWNTNASGTGTNYSNQQSVTNLSSTQGATVNLYAKWTGNSYTVTYDGNGGSIPSTSGYTVGTNGDGYYYAYKSVPYCGTYGTQPTPSRSGYTFAGWYSLYEAGNISMTAGNCGIDCDYTGRVLKYNLQPGETYTVSIASATRSSGSASVFTTNIFDASSNTQLTYVNTAFGSNKTVTLTVPSSADRTHKLRMYIYCGEAGATSNNSVTFTNIRVSSMGTGTSTKYTSSSNVGKYGVHSLVAKWTSNSKGGTANTSSLAKGGISSLASSMNFIDTTTTDSTNNNSNNNTVSDSSYTLNVNRLINNSSSSKKAICGTFDVYINNEIVANNVTSFNKSYISGTTYEIKDIKATGSSGCTYTGEEVYSGTINDSDISINMPFVFLKRTYYYNRGIQSFIVPISGTYKLEVWGAQGFTSNSKGGYSYGNVYLEAGTTIYVVAGETGKPNGASIYNSTGSGGGSTHIGTFNSTIVKSPSNTIYLIGSGGGSNSGSINGVLNGNITDNQHSGYGTAKITLIS